MDSRHAWPLREGGACSQRGGAKGASGLLPTKGVRRYASLRGRRDFALVLRRGRASSTKHLVIFTLRPSTAREAARVGIVITKKVGTAVERNRLRRRCKAILDQSAIGDSRLWYVVQFRPAAAQLSYQQLAAQLQTVLATSLRAAGEAGRPREIVSS